MKFIPIILIIFVSCESAPEEKEQSSFSISEYKVINDYQRDSSNKAEQDSILKQSHDRKKNVHME